MEKVQIYPQQFQSFYEALKKAGLDPRRRECVIEMEEGRYEFTRAECVRAAAILRKIDGQDGRIDGRLNAVAGADRPIGMSGMFKPAKNYLQLKKYLSLQKIVYSSGVANAILDRGSSKELLRKTTLIVLNGGWTVENLRRVKKAFESVGGAKFFFYMRPELTGVFAITNYSNQPEFSKALGLKDPYYYSANLAQYSERLGNDAALENAAEHERIHVAIIEFMAKRNSKIFFVRDKQRLMNGRMLMRTIRDYLGKLHSDDQAWASLFGDAVSARWVEESMVAGYHISQRGEGTKAMYLSEARKVLEGFIAFSTSRPDDAARWVGKNYLQLTHYAALAKYAGDKKMFDGFIRHFTNKYSKFAPSFTQAIRTHMKALTSLSEDSNFKSPFKKRK